MTKFAHSSTYYLCSDSNAEKIYMNNIDILFFTCNIFYFISSLVDLISIVMYVFLELKYICFISLSRA